MNGVKKEGYEKKPISPITVTGGMIGSVIAMVIGSFFGTKGTLFGAALGSGASATIATVYENTTRKAHARLRAIREQEQHETQMWKHPIQERLIENPLGREALIRARQKRILQRERNPWKTAAISMGVLFGSLAVAVAVLFTIETATGKTLHSNLTGRNQYGTSFNYTTVPPSPQPTPAASFSTISPSAVSSSPNPSVTPTADPDAAPVITPTGGAPSGQTGIPTSSASATPPPNGQTAPAAGLEPSSSTATSR